MKKSPALKWTPAILLAAVFLNKWTLQALGFSALLQQSPWVYAGIHAGTATLLILAGLCLVQGVRSSKFQRVHFLITLALALLGASMVYMWAFHRKAPVVIAAMGRWTTGSSLFAYDEKFLNWASDYVKNRVTKSSSPPKQIELHGVVGDYFLRVGNMPRALEHLQAALEIAAENEEGGVLHLSALRRMAVAHLRSGEIDHCLATPTAESCLYPLRGAARWQNPTPAFLAQKYLQQYLNFAPENAGAKWLMNIAHMASGTWPQGVPPAHRLPTEEVDSSVAAPKFENIAQPLGLDTFNLSGGGIMDDFDGDGLLDIMTSSYDRAESLRYFHNEGNGHFSDWTVQAGLIEQKGGLNIVQADYDNDGRLDLLVCRGAWMGRLGKDRNSLLRQNEDGTFHDITVSAGLGEFDYPCLAAGFADLEGDGDLDLFIGNERLYGKTCAPSQLFVNNGDGTFTDIATSAGVTNDRDTRGIAWGDYDNDGDPDLYVSNWGFPNRLYRNNGDNTFTDVAEAQGVASNGNLEQSFATWFFDFDNDGWLDLFCASYPMINTVDPPAMDRFGLSNDMEKCRLYRNNSGKFEDVSAQFGLDRTHMAMAANYGDMDNDGWPDFYLATGGPPLEAVVPNVLYKNQEGRRFADVTTAANLGHLQKGHGVAFGDVDLDGDLDLFCQLGGWYLDDKFGNAMFLNTGPTQNSLTLRLRGTQANRFAVGARLHLQIEEPGPGQRSIHLVVNSGGSFGGNSLQQEVGIGHAQTVKRLQIDWPGSGLTQIFEDLSGNQVLEITEGDPNPVKVSYSALNLTRESH